MTLLSPKARARCHVTVESDHSVDRHSPRRNGAARVGRYLRMRGNMAGVSAMTETVTVLFCDLVGSTALLSRLGDDANDEVRRDVFAALREPLRRHRGVEVKSQGDGLMVAFRSSAADGLACAIEMQR